MVVYRLLGSGVTDANGVASVNYTGAGAGEMDFIASTSNPIDESSLVSETYEVLDCYKYDKGLSGDGNHNDIWSSMTNTQLNRSAEYSTIKEITTGSTGYVTFVDVPLTNYRIEVDVFQVDGNTDEWIITVLNTSYTGIAIGMGKLNEWKHISLDVTNAPLNTKVRLNTGGSCTEVRFKNFKLYPI